MKRLFLPFCFIGLLMSCGGLKVKAPRKKLPDLTESSEEWEGIGAAGRLAGGGASAGFSGGFSGGGASAGFAGGTGGGGAGAAGGGLAVGSGDGLMGDYFLTDTTVGGRSMYALHLPGPAYDSVTLNLMRAYEPMGGSVFELLAHYGKAGVVVDLRVDRAAVSQATYSAERGDGKTIMVVVLWDSRSVARANTLVSEFLRAPGIKMGLVENASVGGNMDCFLDRLLIGFDR